MFIAKTILFFLIWLLIIFAFFLLVDFVSGKVGAKKIIRLAISIVLTIGFTIGTVFYLISELSVDPKYRVSVDKDPNAPPDKALDTAKVSIISQTALHDIIGMTKTGVVRALGLPADTLLGTDNYEEWRYRIGEHTEVDIIIIDGKVKQVLDSVLFK